MARRAQVVDARDEGEARRIRRGRGGHRHRRRGFRRDGRQSGSRRRRLGLQGRGGTRPARQHPRQLGQIHGLGDEIADPGVEHEALLFLEHAGAKGNHRQFRQFRPGPDGPGRREAIHDRHLHVHQDGIEPRGLRRQPVQGLLAIGHQGGQGPLAPQGIIDEFQVEPAVVRHQDARPRQPRARGGTLLVTGRSGRRGADLAGKGQLEPEGAALVRDALRAQTATHEVNQAFTDRQPQAGAAEAAGDAIIGLREGDEEAVQGLGLDADARVRDLEPQADIVAGLVQDADAQADPTLVGELDGVAHQIDQNLFQTQAVADQIVPEDRGLQPPCQLLGPRHGAEEGVHRLQRVAQGKGVGIDAQLPRLDAREVENVVEDTQQGASGGADIPQHVPLARAFRLGLEQLRQTQHGVERGADLVAHVGQEAALGPAGGLGLHGAQLQLQVQTRHLLLEPLLGADIHIDAHDPFGPPLRGAAEDLGPPEHPHPVAILVAQPQFLLAIGPVAMQGLFQTQAAAREILRVDQPLPGREIDRRQFRRLMPGEARPLVIGATLAGKKIPFPDADLQGLDEGRQTITLGAQLRLQGGTGRELGPTTPLAQALGHDGAHHEEEIKEGRDPDILPPGGIDGHQGAAGGHHQGLAHPQLGRGQGLEGYQAVFARHQAHTLEDIGPSTAVAMPVEKAAGLGDIQARQARALRRQQKQLALAMGQRRPHVLGVIHRG